MLNKRNKSSAKNTRRRIYTIPKGMGTLERPFPAKRMIKVVTTSDGSVQAAAAGFVVIEARLADPTNAGFSGGTGAFSVNSTGIADMTAYALARVQSIVLECTGTNLDTGAVVAFNFIFSDVQPSTVITTYALAKAAQTSYLHTPIRKLAIASGNSSFKIPPVRVTPRQVIGDIMPTTDRDFVTVVNPSHTAPSQEWWVALVCTSVASGTNLTNGMDVNITLTQDVEAFSRLVGT